MTPEERARKAISNTTQGQDFTQVIAAAIRDAIAEEREACAEVCEESTARCSVPDDLAAAIRART